MKITFLVASLAVVAMTVLPAVFDGTRRFRWGQDAEIIQMVERLNEFPKRIGGWESVLDHEISEGAANQLQPLATISRTYFNKDINKQAQVFILLGPTGPTAAHTPDICYNSREYRKLDQRRKTEFGSRESTKSTCFVTSFESRDANRHFLRSWYAWTIDGDLRAPVKPRFTFADSRFLVKIQIASTYADREAMESDEDLDQFVADVSRTLRKQLF